MALIKKFLVFFLIMTVSAFCQEKIVHGKVTYVTSDAVYTSLGRNAGIRDSSTLYVIGKNDTIATLKVFAISSKSSVGKILSSVRTLKIDDDVIGTVVPVDSTSIVVKKDSMEIPSTVGGNTKMQVSKKEQPSQSFMSLQGRISAQYFTYRYSSSSNSDIAQPSIVVNLNGKLNNSPIRFEMYGNFRTISFGSSNPFSSNSTNQSRIYKLAVDYDDSINCLSLGRIIPAYAASAGYIDGAMFTRKFDKLILGTALGFEPDFTQQSFTSSMKKFTIFGAYANTDGIRYNAGLLYSKRFYNSALDREVVSGSFNIFPSNDIFLFSQSDVDLRTKSGSDLISRAKLSSLVATVNYRATDFLSIGGGVNAWRPTYSFSTIAQLPDSLVDQQLRTSPDINVNINLPEGFSLRNDYSPLTSNEKFGKEYLNNSSVTWSNFLNEGVTLQGTMNINATAYNATHGFGGSARKSFSDIADFTVRYQWYRYNLVNSAEIDRSKSLSTDLMIFLTRSVTLWGSYEWLTGTYTNGQTILTELSWRF